MNGSERYIWSFSSPDEVIELETVRSEIISRGGLTVSHDVQAPGWRWSVHVRPLVGTEWCQVRHIGVVLKGRIHYLLEDGTEFEAGPLDVMDIPPGHDAWVVGDEPLETIAWTGARGWLAPLESLSERVLATILFTDIVDSTSVAMRVGDRAWGDLMGTHETRTRDILARFRGREVKMTGDGLLAVFDGAARAVRCATVLRDTAKDLGLTIRAAVHTGEIEVVGEDIRGLAVHEASRVLGLAGPDQVLVSAATTGLIGDMGVALDDFGEHDLRGIGLRRVFSLR